MESGRKKVFLEIPLKSTLQWTLQSQRCRFHGIQFSYTNGSRTFDAHKDAGATKSLVSSSRWPPLIYLDFTLRVAFVSTLRFGRTLVELISSFEVEGTQYPLHANLS